MGSSRSIQLVHRGDIDWICNQCSFSESRRVSSWADFLYYWTSRHTVSTADPGSRNHNIGKSIYAGEPYFIPYNIHFLDWSSNCQCYGSSKVEMVKSFLNYHYLPTTLILLQQGIRHVV